jgi:hypothetical protein
MRRTRAATWASPTASTRGKTLTRVFRYDKNDHDKVLNEAIKFREKVLQERLSREGGLAGIVKAKQPTKRGAAKAAPAKAGKKAAAKKAGAKKAAPAKKAAKKAAPAKKAAAKKAAPKKKTAKRR